TATSPPPSALSTLSLHDALPICRLGRLFADGKVEKIYWAVVAGAPDAPEGRIETGLRKETRGTGWHMIVDPEGQPSVTEYRVLRSEEHTSELQSLRHLVCRLLLE